jgi:hypothetical protein
MALVSERYSDVGTELFIYPESRKASSKPSDELKVGDTVAIPVEAVVLLRFPEK